MNRVFLILTLIFSMQLYGQANDIPFKGKAIVTDQFGYYYEISDHEIKKFTSNNGNLNFTYSNNLLGVIANVDVTNPYKILVYFRDFTKIIILDNTLSPTSELIELKEINLDETSLVCRSYNNGFWYYNFIRFQLIRADENQENLNKSANISNLINKNIQPNFIIEYNNRVYLNDPKNGILVFDIYGTYLKTIPIYNLDRFQVKDKFLLYVNQENQIEWYNFFTLEKQVYFPEKYKNVKFVHIENDNVFVVDNNQHLSIDKIKK